MKETRVRRYWWELEYYYPSCSGPIPFEAHQENHKNVVEYAKYQLRSGKRITNHFREFGIEAEKALIKEAIPIGGKRGMRKKLTNPTQGEF